MECSVEDDDVVPAGRVLGHLDGGLEHVIAAVGEEEGVDRRRRDLVELGRQRLEQVVGVHVLLGVDESGRLVRDRLDDLRVAVAGGRCGDAGSEVEILVAIDVDHPATVAADDLQIGGLGPDARRVRNR